MLLTTCLFFLSQPQARITDHTEEQGTSWSCSLVLRCLYARSFSIPSLSLKQMFINHTWPMPTFSDSQTTKLWLHQGFTVASQPHSVLVRKGNHFLYLLLSLWQTILFTSACLWTRAGTRQRSLYPASIQIPANSTASLNTEVNVHTDYSVLQRLQFKGKQEKLCQNITERVHTFPPTFWAFKVRHRYCKYQNRYAYHSNLS